ncbi:MAG: hypothetical protein EHM71_17665 [Zetaproteobacteria bacterium]|nr:MAG: hypothetical protein EHM71_17665 [Zetaproteobacteria bacterium]
MQTIRVAAVSMNSELGKPAQALDAIAGWCAQARRYSFEFLKGYALRVRENSCFGVLADQAGRAGYVDLYPRTHPNQPHHAGSAIFFAPDGEVVAHAQTERIRDEIVVATLDAAALAHERSQPNYTLRTRRPELFGELIRDQVSA